MNRRQFKKHINQELGEFVANCIDRAIETPSKVEAYDELIDRAAHLLDDVLHEVSNTHQFVGKEVKHHYARIWKDYISGLEALQVDYKSL